MESVLIVASGETGRRLFEDLLAPRFPGGIATAGDAGEAQRRLLERDFDLCLINTPLSDEFGVELAESLVRGGGAMQVLLFVKAELLEQVAAKMEPCGVFVLAKPVNKQLLWSTLQLLSVTYNRLCVMQRQNTRLQQKLEDIRLIDRAKCTLIAYLGLTEPEAHKHIEKQAMDMRKTRREVAEGILHTYEG